MNLLVAISCNLLGKCFSPNKVSDHLVWNTLSVIITTSANVVVFLLVLRVATVNVLVAVIGSVDVISSALSIYRGKYVLLNILFS